jgi:hypothetical protein
MLAQAGSRWYHTAMNSAGNKGVRTRVEQGIFSDRYGIAVVVSVAGVQRERRFAPNTTISTLREGRQKLRDEMIADGHVPRIKRGGDGPPSSPWVPPMFSQCEIYFIVVGDAVKIGRSVNAQKRALEIQTSHHAKIAPSVVVCGTHATERHLHDHFAADRIRGEWFRLTPAIARMISQLSEGADIASLLPSYPTV